MNGLVLIPLILIVATFISWAVLEHLSRKELERREADHLVVMRIVGEWVERNIDKVEPRW